MNCFHADRLLEVFNAEEVRPFSKQLDDHILLSEIINSSKSVTRFSNASLTSYMVSQEARTRILSDGLRTVRKAALTEAVIQLQEALGTALQSPISSSNLHLLKQLFFCACARLLSINNGKKEDAMMAILYLLSMDSWVGAKNGMEDEEICSWSALLFLEAILTVRHHDPLDLNHLLLDEELAGRIVKSLVPGDTSIMSLHLKNFEASILSCCQLKHTWSHKNTINLAREIAPYSQSQCSFALFVKLLLDSAEDFLKIDSDLFLRTVFPTLAVSEEWRVKEQKEISLDDLKLFLITSGIWARLMLLNEYSFSSEQYAMWNNFVNVAQNNGNLASIMRVREETEVLRCQYDCLSSKFLYSIFKILEASHFSSSFCYSYATRIRALIEGGHLPSKSRSDRLFPLDRPAEEMFPTVEEEEIMYAHVCRYLARYNLDKGDFAEAEAILQQFNGDDEYKALVYVYQQWLAHADDKERQRIKPVLFELLKKTSPTDSEWHNFEKLCSGNSTTESSNESSRSNSPLTEQNISRKSCGINTDDHSFYENAVDSSVLSTMTDKYTSVDDSFMTAITSPHHASDKGNVQNTSIISDFSETEDTSASNETEYEETEFLCELLQVQVGRMLATPSMEQDHARETMKDPVVLRLEAEGQQARSKITFLENELERIKNEKSSACLATETKSKFMQFRNNCNIDTPQAYNSPDCMETSPSMTSCPTDMGFTFGLSMNVPSSLHGFISPTVVPYCSPDMFNFRNAAVNSTLPTLKTDPSLSSDISQVKANSVVGNNVVLVPNKGCHPGHSRVCLGCLDDDQQDEALAALNRIASDWEKNSDNEDEC